MKSTSNPETLNLSDHDDSALSRRQALTRLGLSAAVMYVAPALLPLNRAAAASHEASSVSSASSVASDATVASLASDPSDGEDPPTNPVTNLLRRLLGFAN